MIFSVLPNIRDGCHSRLYMGFVDALGTTDKTQSGIDGHGVRDHHAMCMGSIQGQAVAYQRQTHPGLYQVQHRWLQIHLRHDVLPHALGGKNPR